MDPLSPLSYCSIETNKVVICLIVISLGFYILFLVTKVRGWLENVSLKLPTRAEGRKPHGGDLIIIEDILLTSELIQNLSSTFKTIIEEGIFLVFYLEAQEITQSLSFISLHTCSAITNWSYSTLPLPLPWVKRSKCPN